MTTKTRVSRSPSREPRRKLRQGEYWCLFSGKGSDEPQLILNTGPYFESNAKANGNRIAVVRLVEV